MLLLSVEEGNILENSIKSDKKTKAFFMMGEMPKK